jgi:hypothetical protein
VAADVAAFTKAIDAPARGAIRPLIELTLACIGRAPGEVARPGQTVFLAPIGRIMRSRLPAAR